MATATVNAEMDFTWKLAREVAPKEVISKYAKRGRFGGLNPAKMKSTDGPKVSNTLGGE